ncbi:hypothetical protein AVEN_146595-1 [Araneus ventricosus]|uniref:Uncharacterized protein n=1 Tax=Araneus ventricosus TaxID=182803 RepID=A0A4Y2FTK8_ARAVE|nr:hypothetical protein AVEN_195265-1 [Araneus ventricosus]GBM43948.1 hypothetical protein AVEN_146595-1 [Araneus ventricosus]
MTLIFPEWRKKKRRKGKNRINHDLARFAYRAVPYRIVFWSVTRVICPPGGASHCCRSRTCPPSCHPTMGDHIHQLRVVQLPADESGIWNDISDGRKRLGVAHFSSRSVAAGCCHSLCSNRPLPIHIWDPFHTVEHPVSPDCSNRGGPRANFLTAGTVVYYN